MNNNSMDNLFEELLKESASLAADELGEEAAAESVGEFSKEHKAKMKKLFARERLKRRMKKFGVYATRTAAVLLIVVVGSGVAIFNVDALKTRFLNMFTDTQPTNTEVSFKEGTSYSNGIVTVGYVPEGFEVEGERITKNFIHLKFKQNEEEYFIVNIRNSYGNSSIDTENAEVEILEINGYEILYSREDNENIFSYYINEYAVEVMGNVEKDLMIEIIKNIKIN